MFPYKHSSDDYFRDLIEESNMEMLNRYYEKHPDSNDLIKEMEPQILIMKRKGFPKEMSLLVLKDIILDFFSGDIEQAIDFVTKRKSLDLLRPFLRHLNEKRTLDHALKKAVKYGTFDMVKFLVYSGADVKAKNSVSLRKAVEREDFEMTKYLLEKGPGQKN